MTLWSLLHQARLTHPDVPAILSPDRQALTYGELADLVGRTVVTLNGLGVGRGDRVALVLDNGPIAAAAFLACACVAAAAPLNPAYKAEEFSFYLEDLAPKAVLVTKDAASPVRQVAAARGIPIVEVSADPAWRFTLAGAPEAGVANAAGLTQSEDDGLLLHTSGTTSRPKLVPLTHANLMASAGNIARTLALGPNDRCLNMMPLFHIHGLVGCLLSTIAAGGSIYCAPGFNALKVFGWLEDAKASWYSAVPTMHQAILSRAERNAAVLSRLTLRFVRSSSSPLAPQIMAALEKTFGCPVVESYGMTEAAHQMASNPLPPRPRKPASVGLAAGPEIAIMDEADRLLPPDTDGEIAIRGANVTRGYLANVQANASAFSNGWFRTGDRGYLDGEGYLFITGRLKEMINRGGEKIAPREVDEVLLDHPAVAEVVTFALPHEKLGEEVAAAIVLAEGAAAGENDLRAFAATRLADFKVPRRIVFVTEIPKGPTGKLQRIGLAKLLGLAS